MKKNALLLVLVMLFSAFATMPVAALVFESTVREATIVVMAIPPTDDSMKNPYYELLGVERARDTMAPDGEELDAYVLGVNVPVEEFTGRCIALIHRKNDNEDKLVVAPENVEFSDEEILALTRFPEIYFESIIIRR